MNSHKRYVPKDGLAGLKENFATDALSGFMVFLLALPLSLGIAKASDFPAIYGLVTAVIGGVIVSLFMGARVTIKGPAAGLIVIASGAVGAFGGGEQGWKLALGTIVVAGVLQIAFGLLKLGTLANFFPGAAIHGMLAAIGLIIISKQIHLLLGIDPALLKGKDPLELYGMIPSSLKHEHAHLAEIGIACLAILGLLSLVKNKNIKKIPPPLVVLFVAIPLGYLLHIKHDHSIENFAMVKVGSIVDEMAKGVAKVDFSGVYSHTGVFIQYVILFALIGTIESLLTAKAMDNLDPYKRKSDYNKDVTAVGMGNVLSGILGGLPMISEVARSSANISYGAKTRWSNFFHGFFLLLALLFAVSAIEMIPNTALAAMLIFVGWRLAHPREFIHMYHVGIDQLFIFTATVVLTLATDLLIGVFSGVALDLIYNYVRGLKIKNTFKPQINTVNGGENYTINIEGALTFSNWIGFSKRINTIPAGKNVTVNVSHVKLIDHTFMTNIQNFKRDYENGGGKLEMIGTESLRKTAHHDTSALVKR